MKTLLLGSAATLALISPGVAFAQSTGTIDFEKEAIVVTGASTKEVGGISVPDTSKARAVMGQEMISTQRAGDSILNTINLLPGVSFQSNDPYGSSGGSLTIRGFSADRVSLTFDGIPLNDTGNYALYSNQQLDPELIEEVSVSLGSTDIDSPTASASGSTVNYRTRMPTEDFHANLKGSAGEYGFFRMFGMIDTGVFTPFGTRAFFAASHAENYNPYNHNSKVDKYQYNGKIYQPLGSGGDFIALSGHYNRNRNDNFSSIPLRTDATIINSKTGVVTGTRIVGSGSDNRFPTFKDEREYTPAGCQTDTPQAGVADVPNTCGTTYDDSYNPSNTGNIRLNSRFTLADGLVLTVDPSYSYTKANGGKGAVVGYEYNPSTQPYIGYVGGKPYFGVDLNGDGDTLDQVELYSVNHTETKRFVVISSLRYDINSNNTVRLNYTFDHGRHRQTGAVAFLNQNGKSSEYFPIDNPILDVNGDAPQKRNRLSYAILHQVSGEYRGTFLDEKLIVNLGLRAPFFKRKLNNYCVSESGGLGYVDCFSVAADQAAFLAANPSYAAPQSREFNYSRALPSAGLTYHLTPAASLFANYSKGLQVPGTDNLYSAFEFPLDNARAKPKPETTDNFDLGVRYRTSTIQAQLSGWYTIYNNRLAKSYDPELDVNIYRNLGRVDKYGIDGSIAYRPIPEVLIYTFGSYLKSKIKDDVITGESNGSPIYALTGGKRESAAPTYTFGARVQGDVGPLQFGVQAKRTGPRYVNDQNLPVMQSYKDATGKSIMYQVYGAKSPAYTVVDLDARLSLNALGLPGGSFLQLNVTNLFDKLYVAGFSGNTSNTNVANAYIGAPRTVSGTLSFAF